MFEPKNDKSTLDLLKFFDNYMREVFELIKNETGFFLFCY